MDEAHKQEIIEAARAADKMFQSDRGVSAAEHSIVRDRLHHALEPRPASQQAENVYRIAARSLPPEAFESFRRAYLRVYSDPDPLRDTDEETSHD